MANKTLLDGVNEVLKRVSVIQGDTGALATLSDSAKQVYIDLTVQVWNEAVDHLYSISSIPRPMSLAKDSITLVTSDRDYALNASLVRLHYPLINESSGQRIDEYPSRDGKGSYMTMIGDQDIPANYTGQPMLAAIDPIDNELYLNMIPTSEENGDAFQYWYDTDLGISTASATFPFRDAVFRAMVPVVAEAWKLEREHSFNDGWARLNFGRASRLLTQKQMRDSYMRGSSTGKGYDPYDG